MDREETLALYGRGREAWNEWAKSVPARMEPIPTQRYEDLAEADFSRHTFDTDGFFSGFIFPGRVTFEGAQFTRAARFGGADFRGDANFEDVQCAGEAEFSDAAFEGAASFRGTTFRCTAAFAAATFGDSATFVGTTFVDDANFDGATFKGLATFGGAEGFALIPVLRDPQGIGRDANRGATFHKGATFRNARFHRTARFAGTTFRNIAAFAGATFEGDTVFQHAIFEGAANFGQAAFEGRTSFLGSWFRGPADFAAVKVSSFLVLSGSKFCAVPVFHQAQFAQAPRLDDFKILGNGPPDPDLDATRWSRELSARWSELKRLAIQRHDHRSEQRFFRRELLARRWHVDRWCHLKLWAGFGYQLFSGCGGSIGRPLLGWLGSVAVFIVIAWCTHSGLARDQACEVASPCEAGSGEAAAAALKLSLHKALFSSAMPQGELEQAYVCLFGETSSLSQGVGAAPRPRPVYPLVITILGFVEFAWSAIMLFLLGLGLRHHFRIR